jgi:transaldolase
MQAWLTGLAKAKANGHDLSKIDSVASFFVSRVDTLIDAQLTEIGSAQALALKGKAAIANARLAYEAFEQMLTEPTWLSLQEAGAHPQRPLWASTGVKDPAYPDTQYVIELVAPKCVNTMPEATLNAVADHGDVRGNTIKGTYALAAAVFSDLASVGINFSEVFEQLETEGVEKFIDAWQKLLDGLATALKGIK